MNTARPRPYAKPEDLRAMQRLAQRIWSPGEPVAWGWAELPDTLALQVYPARPDLAAAVLDWFASVAKASPVTATVLDAETHLITALEQHGYARQNTPHFQVHMSHPLAELPQPELPDGSARGRAGAGRH